MTEFRNVDGLQDVSRETIDKLRVFEALIIKWNKAINLVSRGTVSDLWHRHFVDSAQVFRFCPPDCRHWVDIGSGGGFPGLVVAILAAERRSDIRFTLIESDQRKCTFLRQVSRDVGLPVTVLPERIETTRPLGADVISARALAPLTTLCGHAARHGTETGSAIFQKGPTYLDELQEARKAWSFDFQAHPSTTAPDAVLLTVRNIRRLVSI